MKLWLALGLGVAVVAAALALLLRPQPSPWEARVSDEILHAPSTHWLRPTLGDGGTGHFGDILESDWTRLLALDERWTALDKDLKVDCYSAVWGEDFARFHPECRQWLDDARAELPLIRRATEAPEAGPPARLDPLRVRNAGGWGVIAVVDRVPSFDARVLENDGEHARALDSCVTALAVARDLEWGFDTSGYHQAERAAELAFFPCAAAVQGVDSARRARFRNELSRLQAGRPPLVHGFILGRSGQLLHWYGYSAPREVLERADPAMRKMLDATQRFPEEQMRSYWPELIAYQDGLVDAASRPIEQRRGAFNALRPLTDAKELRLDSTAFEAYRSVDAVFEGLSLFTQLIDDASEHRRWPETLPRGTGVRFSKGEEGVSVLLDFGGLPLNRADGGVTPRKDEWLFPTPPGWGR